MKKAFAILVFALAAAGCAHPQIPSNPTVYACPTATAINTWTPLETAATELTGTSLNDTPPSPGPWCYGVTEINNTMTPIAQSVASNIVLVTTTAALPVSSLTWTNPASSPVPITGQIAYRIAAVAANIAPATMQPPTAIVELVKPADNGKQLAVNTPARAIQLTGHAGASR